jgi:hypothetical protein
LGDFEALDPGGRAGPQPNARSRGPEVLGERGTARMVTVRDTPCSISDTGDDGNQ